MPSKEGCQFSLTGLGSHGELEYSRERWKAAYVPESRSPCQKHGQSSDDDRDLQVNFRQFWNCIGASGTKEERRKGLEPKKSRDGSEV